MTPNLDKLTTTIHRRLFASSVPQEKVTVRCYMVFPWFRIPPTSLHSLFMAQQWHRRGWPFHQLTPFSLLPPTFQHLWEDICTQTSLHLPYTPVLSLFNHFSIQSTPWRMVKSQESEANKGNENLEPGHILWTSLTEFQRNNIFCALFTGFLYVWFLLEFTGKVNVV